MKAADMGIDWQGKANPTGRHPETRAAKPPRRNPDIAKARPAGAERPDARTAERAGYARPAHAPKNWYDKVAPHWAPTHSLHSWDQIAMPEHDRPPKAYMNQPFLESRAARGLRILSEYVEPLNRFQRHRVDDTIVFMGSARLLSREAADAALKSAEQNGEAIERARQNLELSAYYEAARELAYRLTEWSKTIEKKEHRFVVCTGGGPGIMEAANRGASEAKGPNVGLTISIPNEEFDNPYVSRELHFHFHYFFMRKFWFIYLAKAVVLFPGGFGTLDEMFEILTLVQTRKMRKRMPIVLFGEKFWNEVINFDALVRYGTISPEDVRLFHRTDSVDEAYKIITTELLQNALPAPGATL
jgi:hypothetical protein